MTLRNRQHGSGLPTLAEKHQATIADPLVEDAYFYSTAGNVWRIVSSDSDTRTVTVQCVGAVTDTQFTPKPGYTYEWSAQTVLHGFDAGTFIKIF